MKQTTAINIIEKIVEDVIEDLAPDEFLYAETVAHRVVASPFFSELFDAD